MRVLSTIIIVLFTCNLFAQMPSMGGGGQSGAGDITGNIEGILLDSVTQKPVEFASIILIKPKSKKEVDGLVTDERGRFKFSKVALGKYALNISFLGYSTKETGEIEVTKQKPDKELGTIYLRPESLDLQEVVVTGERATVENKIDKIVYNAEKDVTTAGGDATDVMRKVPMLSVDLDGNVSLRGSQNLRILINGKPSGMFSSNVADALKSLPADQIKSVEVITSPSAKYDGEGSGGIINIITKKKNIDGFNGTVNGAIGNRNNNASISLNAAKGRFGFNSNISTRLLWPVEATNELYRETFLANGSLIDRQNGVTKTQRIGLNGTVGAFYDINGFNSINSSFRINGFKFNRDGNTIASISSPAFNLDYEKHLISNNLNGGFDWNTDYTRTFEKEGQEFSVAFQLTGNNSENHSDLDQTFADNNIPSILEKTDNLGTNREYTLQSDYTHPFNKNFKLEVGAKGILRKIDSDYQYNVFDASSNQYVEDEDRTNEFDYEQDVYSGYTSMTYNFGKDFSLLTGVRFEHTAIDGSYVHQGTPFSNSYSNFLPNLTLSKQFKNFQTLKASYNRRIQRPSLNYINPFTDASDVLNIRLGNPKLSPEITDQYDLGYNIIHKGIVVNASTYYKNTFDVIQQFTEVDSIFTITNFQNIGKSQSIGFNMFAQGTIKEFWTLRGNFNIDYNLIEGTGVNSALRSEGYTYNVFMNSSFKFKHGIMAEIFGFFRSPQITLQGKVPSFSMYSIGIKKELFKGNGSIGINTVQPHKETRDFKTELKSDSFVFTNLFKMPFRSFGVTFSYKFGKLDFNNRRTKVKNDDVKQGEDTQQGGGGRQ